MFGVSPPRVVRMSEFVSVALRSEIEEEEIEGAMLFTTTGVLEAC